MTKYWLNLLLLRVILPVTFGACTIWRPAGLSLVYLGLMLYSPIVPTPTHQSMTGHTGRYLKSCIGLTFLLSLTQLTFHIVLLALPPYGHFLQNCQFLEKLLRHIGLVRLNDASVWEVFYWLTPEILTLPITLIVYFVCRRLTQETIGKDDENSSSIRERQNCIKKSKDRTDKILNFLGNVGTYVVLASLCCTASLNPSVEASFYFLVFLGAATWWACHRELSKGFSIVCRIVMVLVILHIVTLLSYQNQWPQEYVLVNSTWARYFGLNAIYRTNCTDPRYVDYADRSDWFNYGYLLRLFWLYYVLALQAQFLARKPKKAESPTMSINERTPLMRFGSGRTGLLQDSTGSVIVQDGHQDDSIQLQSLSEGVPEDKPGIIEHVLMAVYSVFQLVVNSSYLATNIIMMTWSIMYHSWITFALLLWALILWMVPNKRASMMKCSPFIALYATLLLIGQYIYSMDLTEEELPTVFDGIRMSEIGFSKPDELGRWHLIVKCLFTAMFWITMRQYSAERQRQRRTSALRDMVAPLHVSVTTATTAMNHEAPEIKSEFMKNVGVLLKKFLTKFWIAVVAIMLFTCGITGDRMTVFRIIYMSLFLFFVITFQISWTAWRRMMYGFWITVIVYSVIMLILVYTYQFSNFPAYWDYLKIDRDMQMDIGLEIYETKDLFVRLLTPTFFVIITVLQMHYFHDEFLEATNIERLGTESPSRRGSLGHSPSTIPIVSPMEILLSENEETTMYTLKQLKHMSKLERIALCQRLFKHFVNFYNYIWLFLEMHIQKIVFISLILLCINDVCAINFFFVLAVVIAINFKRNVQIMSINAMAAVIAILMVIKMLYQIKYIGHKNWDVQCPNKSSGPFGDNNTVYNVAEWIGMRKAEPGMLPDLLKGYIGIVTVTTIRAIITVRQWFFRQENGEPLETPQVMFPKVTRADADKGIPECLKFLFNYGFYKFGLECCLMGIVALIGTRLDFYSVLYSVWLLVLFSLKRKTAAKVWPFFRTFAIIFLPIQYILVVAPPTWLCIDYPWGKSETLRKLQEWMYLPDPDFPPNPKKLTCDFILLLMIVRQSLVFRIEQRNLASGSEFIAGHNYSVFQDMEKPNFANPVKDYVSHIHNWLDVVKRGSMMSLMWITLSIMFLAGTKRTNLFSLGYLIGAFIFLWQGSDFYLRPVRSILKWWNLLIGYNVAVIFCKAFLQGIGCVLTEELKNSACWLIQLLGIACLKKFRSATGDLGIQLETICEVPREDIGMVWDGLCFGFLLIQKRLFKSYYFFHIVDETKAMSILASRGAELLEELHLKRVAFQESVEAAILQKLKFKMDKIKADQKKILNPAFAEPQTHQADILFPGSRPLYRHRAPITNRDAIRSGDYYMFDDLEDDDDVTELIPDTDYDEAEKMEKQEQRGRRMTVSEAPDRTSLASTDVEEVEREAKGEESSKKPAKDPLDDKAADGSEAEDDKEEAEEEKKVSFLTYFKFLWVMLNSTIVSVTRYLNQYSRDYRYIRKVLAQEKKVLKAKPDFRMGMRLGISQIWQPIPLVKHRSSPNGNTEDAAVTDSGEGPSQPRNQDESTVFSQITQGLQAEEAAELSEVDQPPIIQLAASIWFAILAHSSLLCYLLVFLHQMKNASMLSLPLPLMVFFWGSLTIPRPSKTFWVTMIAYTEIIVIVKCIFQLELIPWNQSAAPNNPLYPPRIIGIERTPNYALWDLLLLLMIFFHRFMLKSLGQWTSPSLVTRKITPSTSARLPTTQYHLQNEGTKNQASGDGEREREKPISLYQEGELEIQQSSTSDDNERLVAQDKEESDQCEDDKFSKAMEETLTKYSEPMKVFLANILDSTGKEKTNVYAYMFLCDFFNFLLIIFGFSAFGTQQGDGGVTAYLSENRVPMPFLLMLLLQFGLIVIDRALFLRKYMLGKLIFQYCLVFGVHVWMFFILPSVTERQFKENLPPQIWYFVKCCYLLLAAYQLRLGYPTRILGNFLCKKYSVVNYVLFKGFMLVPFLFELRAVMDWIWTDTSMTLMDWFKMEDIFASIYQIKCMRGVETDFPQPRGEKKKQMSKYLVGGGALFFIIGLIWFPLLLFALGSTVGVSNLPYEVSMKIRIGPYEPIYAMSAQNTSISRYTEEDYRNFSKIYETDKAAVTFLENYIHTDIAAVKLSGFSRKLWGISPPDRRRLKQELESDSVVTVHVDWTVSRKTDAKDSSGVTTTLHDIALPPYIDGKFNPTRKLLADMLSDNGTISSSGTILLQNAFPKFLKVTSRITAVVPQLMNSPLLPPRPTNSEGEEESDSYLYRNVTLKLTTDENCCAHSQWWFVNETCNDPIYYALLRNIPLNKCDINIVMFLFNDKAFPDGLNFISGFGILGLYTTAVIVISQMMRKMVSEMAPKIMFDDLPYVDRILRLCLDIYLVRESKELCLEEDLFAKLIFLYRSPETLIRWTRPPEPDERAEDDADDENDEDDDRTDNMRQRQIAAPRND